LPGSPFFQHVLAALPESIRLHRAERTIHHAEYIPRATGPAFLTRCAVALPSITIFPQPILYPHPRETTSAYARHHFWGSWRREDERQTAGEIL